MKESKLTYLLKQLTAEQRDELISRLPMGKSAYYIRRDAPGKFTLDEASILCRFLEEIHGQDLDIYHLLNTQVDALQPQTAAQ